MLQGNHLPRYDASNHPLDLAPKSLGRTNAAMDHLHSGKPRTLWPFSVSTAAIHAESALSLHLRPTKTAGHPALLAAKENSGNHPTAAGFVS